MDRLTKYEELERQINDEYVKGAGKPRGCFGTLLYSETDEVCKACEHQSACGQESNSRLGQQDDLNAKLEAEGVAADLNALNAFRVEEEARKKREEEERLAREAAEKAEARRKAAEERAAKKAAEQAAKIEAANADISKATAGGLVIPPARNTAFTQGNVDVDAIKVNSRDAATGGPVDWVAIIKDIIFREPANYREAAAIVREALPNVWGPTAYGYVDRILNGLVAQNVIAWTKKGKTITWLK